MTARTDTMGKPKAQRAESLSEARNWGRIMRRYERAGLCTRCAPQAAYGAQIGYHLSHPPCGDCAPIVATFPAERVNGWRSLDRDAAADRITHSQAGSHVLPALSASVAYPGAGSTLNVPLARCDKGAA